MIVRRETRDDHQAVRALFASVSSPELLDRLRASDAWLPRLSLVALDGDDEIVGHIAGMRGQVGSTPVITLLPPSIEPEQGGRGIGQALMHAVLGAAEALGEPLVGLVGVPPEFFARFGFRPGQETGILAPVEDWRPYFMVRSMTEYRPFMRGTLAFPEALLGA